MLLALAALAPAVLALGGVAGLPATAAPSTAAATTASAADGPTGAPLLAAALTQGAAVYAYNCSVCHGSTGAGLEEARLAFPPDHRRCTQCHKPNNPVVMPLDRPFIDNDMFAIGTPPALHPLEGRAATTPPLAAVAAPEALFAYLRATMPRYHPGRQSDAEYWLLVAYLLSMNERDDAALNAAAAAVASGWVAGPAD